MTLTVNFSAPVTVNTAGGSPTLALNDSGTAAYVGGSGTSALTFGYTVAAGQNTPDLVVSSFNLNGATIQDAATNNADLSGATNDNPARSEEHTSELQSHLNIVCRLLLDKKNQSVTRTV